MTDEPVPLKSGALIVRGGTDARKLATAIAARVSKDQNVVLEYIGAGAGNQAVKAVAIANRMLKRNHVEIAVVPEFVERAIENNPHAVAIQMIVQRRKLAS